MDDPRSMAAMLADAAPLADVGEVEPIICKLNGGRRFMLTKITQAGRSLVFTFEELEDEEQDDFKAPPLGG